jgi:hypothetical protein
MADTGAMFQIGNYLQNHDNFWNTTFMDYRFWVIILGLLLFGLLIWIWFKKNKVKK